MSAKTTGSSHLIVLLACVSSGCTSDARDRAFEMFADGQPAVVAETVTVQWPSGQPVGIVGSISSCGSTAYLTAPGLGTVHQVDLETGRATGSIGRRGGGPGEFQLPATLVADCSRNLLHVVDIPFSVSTFTTPDGKFMRERNIDPVFQNAPGGRALLSSGGDYLYIPGIWKREGFLNNPQQQYYRDAGLAARLSLLEDTSRPLFAPVTMDCPSGDAACDLTTFDRMETEDGTAWVYAQGPGTGIGVATQDGTLVETLDIVSPRFVRDGRRLAPGLGPAATTEWGLTNSTLAAVYAFGNRIAVVHFVNTTVWDPSTRAAVEFDVFMNVFDADGRGLVADLSLPDVPIGRGDDVIYVVDYGSAGRGADGIDSIRLLGISVEDSIRAYLH